MADVPVNVRSSGLRRLERNSKAAAGGFSRMGAAGKRAGAAIRTGLAGAGSAIGRVAGLAATLGGAFGAKQILDFDSALGQLQADAKLTNKDAAGLRKEVYRLQSAFNVNKAEILKALQVAQDFGGITDKLRPKLAALTKRSKATGASMSDLATLFSTFIQTSKLTPDQAIKQIDRLTAQADAGTISMKKLATVLPSLAGLAKTTGNSIDTLGAAMQQIGKTTGGNVDEARTQLQALFTEVQKNSKKFRKIGVRIFRTDPQTGKRVARNINEIVQDILAKTKADPKALAKLFSNVRAARAVKAFQSDFNSATGKLSAKGTFAATLGAGKKATGADTDARLKRRLEGVAGDAEKVKQSLFKLEQAVTSVAKKMLSFAVKNPLLAGGAVLGGVALFKLLPTLLGRLAGGGAGGGIGVQSVFVTNFPPGFGGAAGASTPAAASSKLARAGQFAAGGLMALGVGYAVGRSLDRLLGISDWLGKKLKEGADKAGVTKLQQQATRQAFGATGAKLTFGNIAADQKRALDAARRGVTFQKSAGSSERISAAEHFKRQAAAQMKDPSLQTLPPAVLAALQASVDRMAAEIAKQEVRVTVTAKGGIAAPTVTARRGGSQ